MKRVASLCAILACLASITACSSDGRSLQPASPDQTLSIFVTTVTPESTASAEGGAIGADSSAVGAGAGDGVATAPANDPASMTFGGYWTDGTALPPDSTCKGKGLSPDLKWGNVPADTTELVVTVVDADASGFVHWILAGIDPATPGLVQGKVPRGAVQALNSSPGTGWFAPCPPSGNHRYIFSLYALPKASGILAGMESADALAGLNAPGIKHVSITGTASA